MHETIKKLEASITQEQLEKLKGILKEDYELFTAALASSDDATAKSSVEGFAAALRKRPLRAIKLNRMLTKEQKSLVWDLMPDDDDEEDDV